MIVVVCYDVKTSSAGGAKRLRRISEACRNFGIRVQYSVFECVVDAKAWVELRHVLLSEFKAEEDSLRFYFVDDGDAKRTEHHGVREPIDVAGPLIV